ncbi:hypothetical protein [Pseudonocardia endophytica]|uniref:Uncharacterized protein n=1 Tax=Pseudonocardia endophytica TaxID=401976 RepID=A0A4R1HDC9_PSEEN|nr:hypothetical protein [Pseudonocardia endophytica]TCK20054.1 hypothetical protein EV378_4002 [Pseudonocardia endophytica]
MRWYAERPGRLVPQLVADLLVLVWIVVAVLVGTAVRDGLLALQGPARTLATAGGQVRDTFTGASQTASGLPFVGDDLARALTPGVDAGAGLAQAGQDYGDSIGTLATAAGLLVPLALLLPVLLTWLPLRLRYARRAGAAVAARSSSPDLLALRALSRAPVRTLRNVSPDPAADWRAGDPSVTRRLASLELESLGLRSF